MEKTITITWSTEDVKGVRNDLTDEQAWDVLKYVKAHHDAEIGINWDVLKTVADNMFTL